MATRHEVQQRRQAFLADIREKCRTGVIPSGEILPPVTELARHYNLSVSVAHQTLQRLAQEGVVYSVAGVGTFAGQRHAKLSELFLYLLPDDTGHSACSIQNGFEQRIARLGGVCLPLSVHLAAQYQQRGELPALAGIMDCGVRPAEGTPWPLQSGVPMAGFGIHVFDPGATDIADFDNKEGGRQATQHLLDLGHRRIAYLAFHRQDDTTNLHDWSIDRQKGWSETLEKAGQLSVGLDFYTGAWSYNDNAQVTLQAQKAAQELAARPDITGVVAANDHIALGILAAMRSAEVPAEKWPAIVGFDNLPNASGHLLTSLRLAYEDIGRTAADLLWERRTGQLTGPPIYRLVPMRLVPRISSQRGWSLKMKTAARTSGQIG